MQNIRRFVFVAAACLLGAGTASAQFNLKKAISAGVKTVQAVTLTDEQVAAYAQEYMDWMDAHNPVCEGDDPYAVRLDSLTQKFNGSDGLNIKAYRVVDVNAFCCANGDIRVFAGLMDIMSDEELLGVIGHEIGHYMNKDSKAGFRTALLSSALREGIGAAGGTAAKLSDSQMGDLSEALVSATYSQKQERAADDYGYEFLKGHGLNPWAMAMSFEKLKKMQDEMGGNKTSKVQQLFSTHPDLAARTEAMSQRAAADGFERPAPANR